MPCIQATRCCTDTIFTSTQMPSEASTAKETQKGKRNTGKREGEAAAQLKVSWFGRSTCGRGGGGRCARARATPAPAHREGRRLLPSRAAAPRPSLPSPPPFSRSSPSPPSPRRILARWCWKGGWGGRGWRVGAAGAVGKGRSGRGAAGADAGVAGRPRRKKDGSPRRRRLQAGSEGWGRAPCRRGAVPPGAS